MPHHVSPPPLEEIDVTVDARSLGVSYNCSIDVRGASIVADDGHVFANQVLRGHGAVASVMERKLRDEYGLLEGRVEQKHGYLEVNAISDGDKLIDGDGGDLAWIDADCDDDELG